MTAARMWLLAAAGAGAVYFLNRQAVAVIVTGDTAREMVLGKQSTSSGCIGVPERLARTDRRIELLETKLERSRRELSAAKSALIIARLEGRFGDGEEDESYSN